MTKDEKQAIAKERWDAGLSLAKCAEGLDVTSSTIKNWAEKLGWELRDPHAQTLAAKTVAGLKWEQRRADLLDHLVDDAFGLAEQLFAPVVHKEVKVVGQGQGEQEVEIVEVHLDRPRAADQKNIALAFAIVTDKLLLLAGEATARTESGPIADRETAVGFVQKVRDELAERRRAAEGIAAAAEKTG